MPLFNNKKDDDRHQPRPEDEEDGESAAPDEHTRLLPNRVDSNRALTPDDPAVSPYNLWSIRVLRFMTVLLTVITFVWWVILLVSAFATPPGFNIRGSGFTSFGFACLALANMLFTLIFFGIPSRPVRILSLIMAVSFLFTNTKLFHADFVR